MLSFLASVWHLLLLPSIWSGMSFLLTNTSSMFCLGFSSRSLMVTRHSHGLRSVLQKREFHSSGVSCFSQWGDIINEIEGLLDVVESRNASSSDPNCNSGWSTLNLNDLSIRETKPSPVEEKLIAGRRVYIKRDDLLRLHGSQISGNKARKLLAMNEVPYNEFPSCLVSYGGPQSNSMLALAALVNYKNRQASVENHKQNTQNENDDSNSTSSAGSSNEKGNGDKEDTVEKCDTSDQMLKRFVYYTKKLPRFLRTQPSGNLFRAKSLGMEIIELSQDEYASFFGGDYGGSPTAPVRLVPPIQGDSLWVPQGGAFGMASVGARVLAKELVDFWTKEAPDQPLSVCVPGGTCTMAVLLHHELQNLIAHHHETTDGVDLDIEVVVIPCVGDAGYAKRQMMALCAEIGASIGDIPTILQPTPDSGKKPSAYFPFGQPKKAILQTFETMKKDHDVLLDLIYGAPVWTIMLRHFDVDLSPDLRFDPNKPLAGREILYVHSGGQAGINSQLLRYRHKGLLSIHDVQLPGRNRQ
ncbi:unnamed protein product [Cylindrotheca closterium]|uniref:Tryptophan synthase beta chain-like PALP domain-containing protein n=1 Tax=Cylindrotheca closterium TaxID=2856 RepID=A0AAD2CRL0_9STRA|nr:unnamed protein product [Cylindrotheca closterium]